MQGGHSIKRGAALLLNLLFEVEDPDLPGAWLPVDLTTCTLACQVRDTMDNLVAVLPISLNGTPGQGVIQYSGTAQWPIGRLRCDIELTYSGMVTFTETFPIRVERAVTQ